MAVSCGGIVPMSPSSRWDSSVSGTVSRVKERRGWKPAEPASGRSFVWPMTFGLGPERRVGACRAGRGVTRHCSVRTETGRPPPEAWQRDRWETAWVTARARPHPRFSGRACSWDAVVLACKSPSVTTLLLVHKRAGPEGGPCQPAEGRSGVRKEGSPLLCPKGMILFTLRSQVD